MPALGEGWKEEDDMRADGEPIQTWSGRGLMYKGRWLISPERQERSVRLFWVSLTIISIVGAAGLAVVLLPFWGFSSLAFPSAF